MKPFTLLYFSSFALAVSHSLEHSKQKRSASPQVTINGDPNTLLLGGAAAVGGGLLINHLLGDPAGKAVGNLINKGKKTAKASWKAPTISRRTSSSPLPS